MVPLKSQARWGTQEMCAQARVHTVDEALQLGEEIR